jgi:N-acetylglutamate synthase-like GNAT family acetyltransferase
MSPSNYKVRRATLEDIAPLTALWTSMKFPVEELSKRVTEFQVAEGPEGLVGALGLQIAQKQGRIHSEGYTDFSLADQLRPVLWDRLHALAANHGLVRLWTQETAPFWTHSGLVKPDAEVLAKLPAGWRTDAGEWLTIKLKEDVEALLSVDREFALFMQSERERSVRALQHARILKMVATFIAFVVFFIVLAGAFVLIRKSPNGFHR